MADYLGNDTVSAIHSRLNRAFDLSSLLYISIVAFVPIFSKLSVTSTVDLMCIRIFWIILSTLFLSLGLELDTLFHRLCLSWFSSNLKSLLESCVQAVRKNTFVY